MFFNKQNEEDWLSSELKREGYKGCTTHKDEHVMQTYDDSNIMKKYKKEQLKQELAWQRKELKDKKYEQSIGVNPDKGYSYSKEFIRDIENESKESESLDELADYYANIKKNNEIDRQKRNNSISTVEINGKTYPLHSSEGQKVVNMLSLFFGVVVSILTLSPIVGVFVFLFVKSAINKNK